MTGELWTVFPAETVHNPPLNDSVGFSLQGETPPHRPDSLLAMKWGKTLGLSVVAAAVALAGAAALPARAASVEWVKVSSAQAKQMATQTGFAWDDGVKKGTPKKCWRAVVLSNTPDVGIVYKTKWGKAHSYDADHTCGVTESYLAPIAVKSGGRWVRLADIYFPDCKQLKKDLMSYGVSRTDAKFVVANQTCG